MSGAWVVGRGGFGWVDPACMGALAVLGAVVLRVVRKRPVDTVSLCGGLITFLLLGSLALMRSRRRLHEVRSEA